MQFGCQRLESLAGGTKFLLGRHIVDFFISMTLGKFAPDLRDIFNVRRAAEEYSKVTDDASGTGFNNTSGYFHAVGFIDALGLTFGNDAGALNKLKARIIDGANLTQIIGNQVTNVSAKDGGMVPIGSNGAKFHVFCGIRDENVKEYINSVEQSIANEFYGRHYILSAPASEHFECNRFYKILERLSDSCGFHKLCKKIHLHIDAAFSGALAFCPDKKFVSLNCTVGTLITSY